MHSVVKRGQVYQPTLSGDGKVIAWRDLPRGGVSTIAVKRPGQEIEYLGAEAPAVANPSLNQDGSVVLWEQYAGKNYPDWDLARLEQGQDKAEIIFDSDGRDIDADISDDGNHVVIGHMSRSVRVRTVEKWSKGEGSKQISPDRTPSGLPQIAGDGQRVFYLQLPPRADVPNQIWLQEADGSEKPVVYEGGEDPPPIQKHLLDTNDDGSVLAWIQKEGVRPAQVWRWDLRGGVKEMVDEAPQASQLSLSGDGSTISWVTSERSRSGQTTSRLHWKQGDQKRLIAEDVVGQNTEPTLSDDGNTLVWMWKQPQTNRDHEIRKMTF